ncbi:MAG: DUF835 domain-containing protein [Thermoplasmata archaeon]|nr:DUF835 domain-containing protein [Thermoplasmata archaeon]
MSGQDREYIQIVNIIKRGQRLILQARKSGADVTRAEEYINESIYALKSGDRETAVTYAKNCMLDVIKKKREMDHDELSREGALEKMTKEELRMKCKELGLNPVGLKEELLGRVRGKLEIETVEGKAVTPEPERPPEPEPKRSPEPKPKEVVEPEPEEEPTWSPAADASKLISGLSYLVEEQRADKCYRLFKALREQGKPGFAVARTNPKLLERTYGLDKVDIAWLTDRDVGSAVKRLPPSLESIIYSIEEFIDENSDGVVLLDGIEYLIGNNTFNPVIRFLRRLVDKVSTTDLILMVALTPNTLDTNQVTLMERDLYPLKYL